MHICLLCCRCAHCDASDHSVPLIQGCHLTRHSAGGIRLLVCPRRHSQGMKCEAALWAPLLADVHVELKVMVGGKTALLSRSLRHLVVTVESTYRPRSATRLLCVKHTCSTQIVASVPPQPVTECDGTDQRRWFVSEAGIQSSLRRNGGRDGRRAAAFSAPSAGMRPKRGFCQRRAQNTWRNAQFPSTRGPFVGGGAVSAFLRFLAKYPDVI